jgi:transposase-like protein
VEVSQRLGVSAHSLYGWRKKYAAPVEKGDEQAEGIRRLLISAEKCPWPSTEK